MALSGWDHYNLARVAATGGWPAAPSRSWNGGKAHHPGVFLREHHAARRRRDFARLSRRAGDDRKPALPCRDRAVPRRRRKRRADHRRLHAGGAAVLGSRQRTERRDLLRQRARNRGLVEGRRVGRAEDGGAARGCGRAAARNSLCQPRQRRRGAHLWPRRKRLSKPASCWRIISTSPSLSRARRV